MGKHTKKRDFENSAIGSLSQSVELHNLLTMAPYSLHPMLPTASLHIINLEIARWNEVPIVVVVRVTLF